MYGKRPFEKEWTLVGLGPSFGSLRGNNGYNEIRALSKSSFNLVKVDDLDSPKGSDLLVRAPAM